MAKATRPMRSLRCSWLVQRRARPTGHDCFCREQSTKAALRQRGRRGQEQSLKKDGDTISQKSTPDAAASAQPDYYVHPTAVVDAGAKIGKGTKVWHFSHVLDGASIGERCVLGQNVSIAGGVTIGNNVKIQNNVSIYTGTEVEDHVFLGPSAVLTNVTNPRSEVNRHALYEKTKIRRGATIGANATIVCGITLGRYAFIAAGTVVAKDVPDYALMVGNPARQHGWMSRHGHRLKPDAQGQLICPESGYRYREAPPGVLLCLDLDEDAELPDALRVGVKTYEELKKT
jgi:UDP-2-acetamido-3-amino-2,3-dideoxy-glucuronate N-acetyltransferase